MIMNSRGLFQIPQQSFPTDVTSPSPTQLPGGHSEAPTTDMSPPPPKRPKSDRPSDEEGAEDDEAASAALCSPSFFGCP
jgi:hypothetical protein